MMLLLIARKVRLSGIAQSSLRRRSRTTKNLNFCRESGVAFRTQNAYHIDLLRFESGTLVIRGCASTCVTNGTD